VKGFSRPVRAYEVNPADENFPCSAVLTEPAADRIIDLDNQIRIR
jgi:hypothetical protein